MKGIFLHYFLFKKAPFVLQIPPTEYPHAYQDRLSEIASERRDLQDRHQREYEEALVSVKDELREKEGEEMEEEMKGQIREWFFSDR